VGLIVSDLVDSENPVFYFHFSFDRSESWVAATLQNLDDVVHGVNFVVTISFHLVLFSLLSTLN